MPTNELKVGLLRRLARSRYFKREAPLTNIKDIVLWWESRRAPYNLIVGITGLITCAVILVCATIIAPYSTPDENVLMPDGLFLPAVGVLLYAIAANILYTGGWIVEVVLLALDKKANQEIGPLTFALGLIFSVIVTLLPALLAVTTALVTLIKPAP
jgi:hypothetical protein